MQARLIRLGAAIAVAVAALLFFTIPMSFAASTAGTSPLASPTLESGLAEPVIEAEPLFSVPFTIDDTLALGPRGLIVQATGPSECRDFGGESFRVRVVILQNEAQAIGRSPISRSFPCGTLNQPSQWEVPARAERLRPFEEGPAHVCATAFVLSETGGTWVNFWCREVLLQK
jgi:hypothetical protein